MADRLVATAFQKHKEVVNSVVAHWSVKYANRIFSRFGFHCFVADRIWIRIRIPTS